MPLLEGTSIAGRQILEDDLYIEDGRMSLLLLGITDLEPRLYGRLSVEGGSASGVFYQVFDAALWVPGRYFQLPPTLLPDTYSIACYWKFSGIAWRLFWF